MFGIYVLILHYSKSVLPGELQNDLAYSSNLDGVWRFSIYMCARSIEKETNRAKSVGQSRIASRESNLVSAQKLGRGPVRFCIG